jgi:hypothetical protein
VAADSTRISASAGSSASGDFGKRYGRRPERQRRRNDNEAHGLVEDYGLRCSESKDADKQGQAELCAAQADQPAERADDSAAAESERSAALCIV